MKVKRRRRTGRIEDFSEKVFINADILEEDGDRWRYEELS
jgi:hypothetical protein